jgi:Histidine kinase
VKGVSKAIASNSSKFTSSFKTLSLLTSPYFLSLFISIIIILTLPPIFNKFSASIVGEDRDVQNKNIYYADLKNNGTSEEIILTQTFADLVSLTVKKNQEVINQWNFNGRLPAVAEGFWGSIYPGQEKDIFVFTYRDNKLFLNCVDPLENKVLFEDKPIADYSLFDKNSIDCTIHPCGFYDANKDGLNEFYFSTDISFSKKPRRLFVFDPAKDTIFSSPQSNAALSDPMVFDLHNNGEPDFIFATKAVGNCDSNVTFSDMYAWLMVFNDHAKFEFPPIKIGNYPSTSYASPLRLDHHYGIAVININEGLNDHKCSIVTYNSKGLKLNEREFVYDTDWKSPAMYYDETAKSNNFYVVKNGGTIDKFNSNLSIIDVGKTPIPVISSFQQFDLLNNGKNELVFQSEDFNNLVIYNNNFSSYTIINLPGAGEIKNCSVKLNGSYPSELFALFNNIAYFINYKQNPFYFLRYPIYTGIYFAVFLFIMLIQKTQKHRAELKYETEKRIAELQLKTMKSQLDPHFTLNIINSIGSLFYKQDREKADYIFAKYSKLLRTTILNSDKIVTSLSNELEYVENYLELERFRNNNKFCYEIKIGKHVDTNLKIPKMLIHTFAENAVKHGLKHLEEEGRLFIEITSDSNECEIVIQDNGVGREKAEELAANSTHKGLKVLNQILDLYFNLMKTRITYGIIDLSDNEENSLGTKVIIKIPFS